MAYLRANLIVLGSGGTEKTFNKNFVTKLLHSTAFSAADRHPGSRQMTFFASFKACGEDGLSPPEQVCNFRTITAANKLKTQIIKIVATPVTTRVTLRLYTENLVSAASFSNFSILLYFLKQSLDNQCLYQNSLITKGLINIESSRQFIRFKMLIKTQIMQRRHPFYQNKVTISEYIIFLFTVLKLIEGVKTDSV